MKAGTSWLYHNIRYHPDVQMPPYKEIFYFHDSSVLPYCTQAILANRPARRLRARRVMTHYMMRNKKHIRWYLRYLLLPRTDGWYLSLFSREDGKVSGDVTPTYARLIPKRVAKVHELLPDAKIIYLMRNPIQRAWSQVAMQFESWYGGLERANDEQITELLERIEAKGHFRDSDYLRAVRIWSRHYSEEQLGLFFFDELANDSHKFLNSIYEFLGLSASDQHIPDAVGRKRNERLYPPMPDHFGRYLTTRLHSRLEEQHRFFDNEYTAGWLEYAAQYLQ
jgi:hypothetical protein